MRLYVAMKGTHVMCEDPERGNEKHEAEVLAINPACDMAMVFFPDQPDERPPTVAMAAELEPITENSEESDAPNDDRTPNGE